MLYESIVIVGIKNRWKISLLSKTYHPDLVQLINGQLFISLSFSGCGILLKPLFPLAENIVEPSSLALFGVSFHFFLLLFLVFSNFMFLLLLNSTHDQTNASSKHRGSDFLRTRRQMFIRKS